MLHIVLLALWCSLVPLAATVSAAEPLPPAKESIAAERLVVQRLDGGTVTFADALGPDGRAVCYAFLHPNCPLAREYGPVLGQLAADFAADRIRFVGIVCECDDPTEVETYRTSFGLTCRGGCGSRSSTWRSTAGASASAWTSTRAG